MFGRKKKAAVEEPALLDDPDTTDLDEDGIDDDEELADDDEIAEIEDSADDDHDGDETDEWDELDASRDWRDDGPFDIDEVDLSADTVKRLDFGTLVITPFDGMQLQLQLDQTTGIVQTALAMHGNSGLEIALFAAPRSGGLAREVRGQMLAQAVEAGGQAQLAEGPFGTEVRRLIPMATPDGQQAAHVSRTWLAEGPRWLLRGVLMGEAALSDDPAAQHDFVEFFKNVIVHRGTTPMPSGDLIPMTLPDELRQPQQ